MIAQKSQCHDETSILCYHSTQSDALDLHAKTIDESQRGEDVHHILHDGDKHGDTRVLHADVPSQEPVKSHHGWCSPDNHIIIGSGEGHHIWRRTDQPEHQPFHRYLEHDEQQGDAQRNHHRANQNPRDFPEIPAPQSLRRHSAGTHTKEAEKPIDKIENHRANGHSADIDRTAHVAHDGDIDHSQQGHGDVRHD